MSKSGEPGELLNRFLASTRKRITDVADSLQSLADPRQQRGTAERLGRLLHTIKGEARLVGCTEIARVTHVAEDILHSHLRADSLTDTTLPVLFEAVDAIFHCVQQRQEGAPVEGEELEQMLAHLGAGVVATSADDPRVSGAEGAARAPAATASASDARPGATQPDLIQIKTQQLSLLTTLVSKVAGALVRNREFIQRLVQQSTDIHALAKHAALAAPDQGGSDSRDTLARAATEVVRDLREFREHHFRLDLAFTELKERVRVARLQPLSAVLEAFPSYARRVAREVGKQVRVSVTGADLSIDQQVLSRLAEPLIHLLRNAIRHGIETPDARTQAGKSAEGRVTISAHLDGEFVRILFADDGAGVDVDHVRRAAVRLGILPDDRKSHPADDAVMQLIFETGLSTADETTELAGRGVGLNAVSSAVDQMGGTLRMETIRGQGTRFILVIPSSLTLSRSLLVESCDQLFAIPNASVVEVFRLPVKQIQVVEGSETMNYRGRALPIVRLRDALGLRGIKDIFVNRIGIVVVRSGDELAGFAVDRFVGEREIVTQPFGSYLSQPPMSSGATLMESGEVVIVLHVPQLMKSLHQTGRQSSARQVSTRSDEPQNHKILYAEDSVITREYAASVLRAHGYQVVEAADGAEALAAIKKESFDLLLTDIQMPELDGLKLTTQVRRLPGLQNLPIIVLSTWDTPETKRMALDAGADTYLVKSQFSAETLLRAIRAMLGGA